MGSGLLATGKPRRGDTDVAQSVSPVDVRNITNQSPVGATHSDIPICPHFVSPLRGFDCIEWS
jgi:hypothetical protein